MTAELPETTPWTPPDAPAKLVRDIAAGTADALTGPYLHAEHDADLEALALRAHEVILHDLNARRRLKYTDEPVGSIVNSLGHRSEYAFNREFARVYALRTAPTVGVGACAARCMRRAPSADRGWGTRFSR
jgi:hypothetical protein